jgi:GntR family transcriptional regulator
MTDTHALPLYLQVSEMLIQDIQTGYIVDGERLPPERELAREFGISVGTLRKSLADLEDKGLLERRQGSGNYVRSVAMPDSVYAYFRLEVIGEKRDRKFLPTARLLSFDLLPKPDYLPAFGTGETAYRLRRHRFIGEVSAAIEEIWLDAAIAPGLKADDLSESIYLFYRQKLGIWVARAEDYVSVGVVPDWGRGYGFDDPTGLIDRMAWSQTGASIEVSRTWFDPRMVRYVGRLR